MKRLPRRITSRSCQVLGLKEPIEVPQHITRIDTTNDSRTGRHGWQVRYGTLSAFVPDAQDDRRRSPLASLTEAKRLLAEVYEPPHVRRAASRMGRESQGAPARNLVELHRAIAQAA